MFGRDKPLRIFKPGKGEKELSRIEARAVGEYAPLYKGGRAKALDRAEEVAQEKVAEAEAKTEAEVAREQAKVEANFWDKLKRVARQIPFLEDLLAAYYAMRDPQTPLQARAALVFGLMYFLWTFDIIPDFLGVMGFADDGTVLATIIAQVGGSITDEHRAKAREALGVV
ncbi:MAG: YkvA family protein [Oceanicaulis sp.]